MRWYYGSALCVVYVVVQLRLLVVGWGELHITKSSNSVDSLNGSFSGKQQPTSNILSSHLFQLSLSTDWGSDPLFFFRMKANKDDHGRFR
jgi:hypothetical protein